MKTIGNQLKHPLGLKLAMFLYEGIKNCRYSIFYLVTKRTTNGQLTENQIKTCQKMLSKP